MKSQENTKVSRIDPQGTIEPNSMAIHLVVTEIISQCQPQRITRSYSSSGEHECLFKISRQSIQLLLDQMAGRPPTHIVIPIFSHASGYKQRDKDKPQNIKL